MAIFLPIQPLRKIGKSSQIHTSLRLLMVDLFPKTDFPLQLLGQTALKIRGKPFSTAANSLNLLGVPSFGKCRSNTGVKHRGSDPRGHENAFGRIDSNCVPNKVSVQGTSSE
jgi:hypothetical protein